jgi:pseudouridine synthase
VGAGEGLRLNKALPNHSRREADRMITAGRITVNGVRATPGTRVSSHDKINLDGATVAGATDHIARELGSSNDGPIAMNDGPIALHTELFTYLKYYKPAGVTTTVEKSDRSNMIDMAGLGGLQKRVFPVGRLDKDSTGLLLVTADGRVPNAMLRSERGFEKSYTVTTTRRVSDAGVATLRAGVKITTPTQRDNNKSSSASSQKTSWVTAVTKPCQVTRVGGQDSRKLRFVLREGRNRQIRRMLEEALSHEVVGLHRDSFGDITLKGLREGDWCECSKAERAVILGALQDAK